MNLAVTFPAVYTL